MLRFSRALGRHPYQDLCACWSGGQSAGAGAREACRVTFSECAHILEVDASGGDEQMHVRAIRHRRRLARLEAPAPEHGVALVDRDRTLVSLAGSDGTEPALVELAVDVALLVARGDAVGVGRDPHLDEMHLLRGRR